MGSALLDNSPETSREAASSLSGAGAMSRLAGTDLRRQAAERLAAHRSRREGSHPASATLSTAPRSARSARIAATVAERYAHTPSYREFLAAEAERAVRQARAAAEVAEFNARVLAAAQQELLDAIANEDAADAPGAQPALPADAATGPLEPRQSSAERLLWSELETQESSAAAQRPRASARFRPPSAAGRRPRPDRVSERENLADPAESTPAGSHPPDSLPLPNGLADGITVRLYRDAGGAARVEFGLPPATASSPAASSRPTAYAPQNEDEARLLDEEIAFRHEPVFEEPAGPPMPLPANLIEFPRQLVASRKARPRLAEGPLREDHEAAPGAGQLRIFEVDPEQIATTAESDAEAAATASAQWTTIWLDSQPSAAATVSVPGVGAAPQANRVPAGSCAAGRLPGVASIGRRVLASAVNAVILAAAFAAFAALSLWIAAHSPLRGVAAWPSMREQARGLGSRGAILDTIRASLPFAACAFALLAAIYQALFFSLSTATPGMRVARIALCTFTDENPARPAVRRRMLALLLSCVPIGFGFLWAMLDEERLAWHDRLCGIYQRSY